MNKILVYLDKLFPNPQCELNYQNDYQLLIAIVLSAQTTDKRVNKVTLKLFTKYPNLESLSNAEINDIELIIKEIGTYHRKAKYIKEIATAIHKNNDVVPITREELVKLPGVGRKTINVYMSEIYKEPCIAVDTHVARVSKRLNLVSGQDDVNKIEIKLMKKIPKEKWCRTHHQLVLFGRYYCKAIKPLCSSCELKNICIKNKK